ncbi:MAG: hypothetical protein JXQ82_06115 [Methanomicrobiaceae archaeon]|nr:hypothetical protein [Methanomicrobiaceae archaeon]
MYAEYLPAAAKKVRYGAPDCNVILRICEFNVRRDEPEMTGINDYQNQSSCSIEKEAVFSDFFKYSAEDDLLFPDKECCAENYCDLNIPPEDELSKIKAYLWIAEKESSDVSRLSSLLKTAEERYNSGDTMCFYETVDAFYAIYEIMCSGRGGRLYPSGDYLSFSSEPLRFSPINPYL